MTLDPKHAEIMRTAPPLNPPGGRLDVPAVPTPTCPEHCSGRHQHDGWVVCRVCGGVKYAVVLHEWRHQAGHSFVGLAPMNGAPPHRGPADLVCCGRPMARRWKA